MDDPQPVAQPGAPPSPPLDLAKQQELAWRNAKRGIELTEFTLEIFKTTLAHAAKTYRRVTLMNYLMFLVGLGLFVVAAAYGFLADSDKGYTVLFAGMGAATFAALFFTGPIEKTQTALSNLVQAEVGFMNYFEQITLWENYALQPKPGADRPDPANIEAATQALQQRTAETFELFQKYLEPPPSSDSH
jgi:hypothetical protein